MRSEVAKPFPSSGGEPSVHEQRRGEGDGAAVAEAGVGVGEIVGGVEPAHELAAAVEVHTVPPRRAGRHEVAPGAHLLPARVARKHELAVQVEEPEGRREVEAIEEARAAAGLVADRLRER